MVKLNQVLAIENGVKTRTMSAVTELHKLASKPDPFYGFSKIYEPKEEGGETFPPENKRVTLRADDVLKELKTNMSELFDITATKDFANVGATANVELNGQVLLENVPVTYLLFLEKQLIHIRTFITKMPTLDEADDWTKEEASGLFKTKETLRQRPAKVQKPIVLYDATEKHPAQTQLITEDVVIGYWKEVKSSGAITRAEKAKYLERVEEVLNAVKFAREKANSVDVEPKQVGNAVLNAIFA